MHWSAWRTVPSILKTKIKVFPFHFLGKTVLKIKNNVYILAMLQDNLFWREGKRSSDIMKSVNNLYCNFSQINCFDDFHSCSDAPRCSRLLLAKFHRSLPVSTFFCCMFWTVPLIDTQIRDCSEKQICDGQDTWNSSACLNTNGDAEESSLSISASNAL